MKILVLGSGGREHSIILKLSQSDKVDKIYAIPGNTGISSLAETKNISLTDHKSIIEFVKENIIDLTIVGPENPLTNGIVNDFNNENLLIFGPSKEAAELEASKAFSKGLMNRYGIPTADYKTFNDYDEAKDYLTGQKHPLVVKASGLAAGKGAIVCHRLEDSLKAIKEIMIDRCFKDAGNEVVIEEFMTGEEASIFAISDGNYYKILAPAQDHKAVFDGDKGPNTGGMGSYSPAPMINSDMLSEIERKIIEPTFAAMKNEGRTYKGVLFVGLMITEEGPKVIEYNCRFGDPETQAILPLLDADLFELTMESAKGKFTKNEILPMKDLHSLCLVLTSGGYPNKYFTGYEITGLDKVDAETQIIHAGTKKVEDRILSNGGRVLNVVCLAKSLKDAKDKAYSEADKINFKDKYCRSDIGNKGIKYYEK
ncbi:MAG: phosphoribosylamine--glycine ligase [Candidatus Delongbacteria bacterium]|nr:phosphoribosylamine--glycine ligase [Candidatus Delongbacteria bacterium]MCG2760082.1 phosphoribosylamine--glycine ligase [Candidatus Delongbacteria bacterium]